MIVELFGPPGAGKTTFAQALAGRLNEHGHAAELILSQRPGESSSNCKPSASDRHPRHILPTISRLARPFGKMLPMVRHPLAASREVRTALALIRVMPPPDLLWQLRLTQYLVRLSRTWVQAADADHVVLLDQGYVQAVCSLAMLSGKTDEALILQALDHTPEPDLAVLLSAPTELLEMRLRDRERNASRMERLLEVDLATSLRSLAIVELLDAVLRRKGIPIAYAASLDPASLRQGVERIAAKIVAQRRFGAPPRHTRSESIRSDQAVEATRPQLVRER